MSSFKNAAKSRQRTHKERSQPLSRNKLGLLEKHKDYQLRARDHEQKRTTLRLLKKRALDKNPDEFYFHMCNAQLEDGEHREKEKEDEVTEEQLKLMQTQDFKYVTYKRNVEAKKVEKLQASLHILDAEGKLRNKHTFFVDTKKEVGHLHIAQRLDTLPQLMDRVYNRPRKEALRNKAFEGKVDKANLALLDKERERSYSQLMQRMERKKKLDVIAQKMELKRHLANKKDTKPKRIQFGTKDSAPIYKWNLERKR